jgi:C-terminal processing protease CtpA/Prc
MPRSRASRRWLSPSSAQALSLMRDLESVEYPTLGFQLIDVGDASFASSVLEGGPAARAGLLPWDRVLSIDGTAVAESCPRRSPTSDTTPC